MLDLFLQTGGVWGCKNLFLKDYVLAKGDPQRTVGPS